MTGRLMGEGRASTQAHLEAPTRGSSSAGAAVGRGRAACAQKSREGRTGGPQERCCISL